MFSKFTISNSQSTKPVMFMNFNNNLNNKPYPHNIQQLVQRPPPPLPPSNPARKPMRWGEPTWFLLHTLSVKIKEEHFSQIKDELLSIINNICSNLPCPDC